MVNIHASLLERFFAKPLARFVAVGLLVLVAGCTLPLQYMRWNTTYIVKKIALEAQFPRSYQNASLSAKKLSYGDKPIYYLVLQKRAPAAPNHIVVLDANWNVAYDFDASDQDFYSMRLWHMDAIGNIQLRPGYGSSNGTVLTSPANGGWSLEDSTWKLPDVSEATQFTWIQGDLGGGIKNIGLALTLVPLPSTNQILLNYAIYDYVGSIDWNVALINGKTIRNDISYLLPSLFPGDPLPLMPQTVEIVSTSLTGSPSSQVLRVVGRMWSAASSSQLFEFWLPLSQLNIDPVDVPLTVYSQEKVFNAPYSGSAGNEVLSGDNGLYSLGLVSGGFALSNRTGKLRYMVFWTSDNQDGVPSGVLPIPASKNTADAPVPAYDSPPMFLGDSTQWLNWDPLTSTLDVNRAWWLP